MPETRLDVELDYEWDDLQGTWETVQVVREGETLEQERPELFQFEGVKCLIGDEDAAWDYDVIVGADAFPGSIDIVGSNLTSRTDDDPYHRLCIYCIDVDTLLLSVSGKDSDPRPTAFESTPENGYWLYRLRRTDRRIE